MQPKKYNAFNYAVGRSFQSIENYVSFISLLHHNCLKNFKL